MRLRMEKFHASTLAVTIKFALTREERERLAGSQKIKKHTSGITQTAWGMEARFRHAQDTPYTHPRSAKPLATATRTVPSIRSPSSSASPCATCLPDDEVPRRLFEEPGRRAELSATMDKLNLKFGHTTVHLGGMLAAPRHRAHPHRLHADSRYSTALTTCSAGRHKCRHPTLSFRSVAEESAYPRHSPRKAACFHRTSGALPLRPPASCTSVTPAPSSSRRNAPAKPAAAFGCATRTSIRSGHDLSSPPPCATTSAGSASPGRPKMKQSERLPLYREAMLRLLQLGAIYPLPLQPQGSADHHPGTHTRTWTTSLCTAGVAATLNNW